MATAHPATRATALNTQVVSASRLAIATALTAAAIFLICWLGSFIPFSSPTHAYITLFTNAEISSTLALVEGTFWSLVFGLIAGAVFALIYNATPSFTRK